MLRFSRIKTSKASDAVIARNSDYARRLPSEISEHIEKTTNISSDDLDSDLPMLLPSSHGLGQATQMEIIIVQSDNVNVVYTITIFSSWFKSGDIMSESGQGRYGGFESGHCLGMYKN